jgi:hypothetical protein
MADFPTEDACSELAARRRWPETSSSRHAERGAAGSSTRNRGRWECAEWGLPDVGDGQGDDGRQASTDADELQAKLGSAHKLGIGSYKTAWLIPAQAAQEHGASRWKKTVEVVEIAHRTKDDALGGGQGRRHFGKIFRRRGMPLQGGPDAIGNFAQDFFEVAVGYRRPRLLSGQIGSLLQRFQFPVPSSREFFCQHVDFTAARVMKSPGVQPLFSKFPVNFPVSREFLPADRFASDCLIRQLLRT